MDAMNDIMVLAAAFTQSLPALVSATLNPGPYQAGGYKSDSSASSTIYGPLRSWKRTEMQRKNLQTVESTREKIPGYANLMFQNIIAGGQNQLVG
jgi:hypothetical protein